MIENYILNNPSDFTVDYALKLLERAKILIQNQNATSDISKFVLLKTLSVDISFSCELILKSILNNYNNGHDFNSWNTHNLLNIFNELEFNDQNSIANEMGISISDIQRVLSDTETSEAYEKRYLYESDTGIPDYDFLCKFANALIKVYGRSESYDLSGIDALRQTFNYSLFSFEDIVKEHTKLIAEKASIFDVETITDVLEEYIVKNMKTCDYALFSELRFKYFDKDSRPISNHSFSKLHSRLTEACKFLVTKGYFTNCYINKNATINFTWEFESLMFAENFYAGASVKELYMDLDKTFSKSRFCTTEYFDHYYSALSFFERVKSITDLLIMDPDKANKIYDNKQKILEMFDSEFLQFNVFTVEEMEKIDIDYLNKLKSLTNNIYRIPKKILLLKDENIRNKVYYFIIERPYDDVPIEIDYIVTMDKNGNYFIDNDKYMAYMYLKDRHDISSDEIDKYISLSKAIKEKKFIKNLILLDSDIILEFYNYLVNRASRIVMDDNVVSRFIDDFGSYFFDKQNLNKFDKMLVLFEFFSSQYNDLNFYDLSKLCNISNEKIVEIYSSFKLNGLSNLFFCQSEEFYQNVDSKNLCHFLDKFSSSIEDYMTINLDIALDRNKVKLLESYIKRYGQQKFSNFTPFILFDDIDTIHLCYKYLGNYFYDEDLKNTDILKLIDFLKKLGYYYHIDLRAFNSGIVLKTYEELEKRGLLFLYEKESFINSVFLDEDLIKILDKNMIKNIGSKNYDSNQKELISELIQKTYQEVHLKDIYLDIYDMELVIDYPEVLKLFYAECSQLENIYKLSIYSAWYKRIINDNINASGTVVSLDQKQKYNLIKVFIDSIVYDRDIELSNRMELVFANKKLLECLDNSMLLLYDVDDMKDIISKSNFQSKDFSDYNYFANLFNAIYDRNVDKDNALSLMNILYNYRKEPQVKKFIRDLLGESRDDMTLITYHDKNGDKDFDNDLFIYLNNELAFLNKEELLKFLDSVSIQTEDLLSYDASFYTHQTDVEYVDKYTLGKEILSRIKYMLSSDNIGQARENLATRIAYSFIGKKIKTSKLNRALNGGGGLVHARKR